MFDGLANAGRVPLDRGRERLVDVRHAGFATPALLSTGENRPIPLFMYLLLLNAGLAWVAFKKGWPQLTILTMILTAIYQWGWVVKFLDTAQLSLAMGIFLVFSVMSLAFVSPS